MCAIYPRLQTRLRRHVNRKTEKIQNEDENLELELFQCLRASRFSIEGVAEAVIELDSKDDDNVALLVRIRGKREAAKQCFLLLEEVLGVIDQVTEIVRL